MSFRTVANLKDSVAGILTGTNLNNVTNLYGAFERAVRTLVQKADIPEASDRSSYQLYNGVYDYSAPSSIFGGAIMDLRPVGSNRSETDVVYRKPIMQFDTTKASLPNGYQVTFEYRTGMPIMRVAQVKAPNRIILDPMSDPTDWTEGGTLSGLAQDTNVYYEAPASLRFNLTGAGTGTLTKTINPLDLTGYDGVGVNFLATYFNDVSKISSISVKLGSSASDYYEVDVTESFLGAWINGIFQLNKLDLANAAATGTPDITAITYLQVSITHTADVSNARLGNWFIALGIPHELLFQSAYIFLASSALSNTITDDNDEIILNDAAYTLLEYEAAKAVSIQMGGSLSTGIVQTINSILEGDGRDLGLYAQYRSDNPSNEIREVGSYYD